MHTTSLSVRWFEILARLVPATVASEDIGDALERVDQLHTSGASGYTISYEIIALTAGILRSSLAEIPVAIGDTAQNLYRAVGFITAAVTSFGAPGAAAIYYIVFGVLWQQVVAALVLIILFEVGLICIFVYVAQMASRLLR